MGGVVVVAAANDDYHYDCYHLICRTRVRKMCERQGGKGRGEG